MADNTKINVKLEKLKFDAKNPRLPHRLQGITEDKLVIDYMVKYGNIVELMKSIAETGYSEEEPLLVVSNEDESYTVVEGNRRLAALKILNNPGLTNVRVQTIKETIDEAKYFPTEIPVILYEKREDVLGYLGYRHITGIKDWGSLEKARYLDQLYEMHINDEDNTKIYYKLAKMIGSHSGYVSKLHLALKLYNRANDEAYYGADITEKQISFSWLTTALGYNGILKFLGLKATEASSLEALNEENYRKLFIWMFDEDKRIISDSRQICDLAVIVEDTNALQKLEKGSSVEEALLYTGAPSEAFLEMLRGAKQKLKQAKDAIEQLSTEPADARELIEDIQKLARTVIGGLDANFNQVPESAGEKLSGKFSTEQLEQLLRELTEQKK